MIGEQRNVSEAALEKAKDDEDDKDRYVGLSALINGPASDSQDMDGTDSGDQESSDWM